MNTHSRIVELAGPPGSGKSTLANALHKRAGEVVIAKYPYFRRISWFRFFARNLLMLMPTLLSLEIGRDDRRLTFRDIALMTILSGWYRVLKRQAHSNRATILLDEGAICLLARLHEFGSVPAWRLGAETWWSDMYEQWAQTLDVVIWLDTPVPILLERIRNREKQYEIGVMSDEDALRHLSRIRSAEEFIVDGLVARVQYSTIIHIKTTEKTPQLICDEVMTALKLNTQEEIEGKNRY